jgi:hypothetical protein
MNLVVAKQSSTMVSLWGLSGVVVAAGRWQRDVTMSYGRGTEKDGVQRYEESTVMGRRTKRAQGTSILSLWLQPREF